MIGNLNKILLTTLILSVSLSCGKIETQSGDGLFENDSGRYQVIEKKEQGIYDDNRLGPRKNTNSPYAPVVYTYKYYLLDTKTGTLSEIDWSKFELE